MMIAITTYRRERTLPFYLHLTAWVRLIVTALNNNICPYVQYTCIIEVCVCDGVNAIVLDKPYVCKYWVLLHLSYCTAQTPLPKNIISSSVSNSVANRVYNRVQIMRPRVKYL